MTQSQFDLDIDPGPLDTSYAPSASMVELVGEIAALEDIEFRFWCAKTLAVNMSSVSPLADAEEVVLYVVREAIDDGGATDEAYILQVDERGEMIAVQHEDDVLRPDDFDQLIFDVVKLPCAQARRVALLQLTQTAAFDQDDEVLSLALGMFSGWLGAVRTGAEDPATNH